MNVHLLVADAGKRNDRHLRAERCANEPLGFVPLEPVLLIGHGERFFRAARVHEHELAFLEQSDGRFGLALDDTPVAGEITEQRRREDDAIPERT